MHPTISTIKSIFEDDLLTDAGDENNEFSNIITILDNDKDEEDELYMKPKLKAQSWNILVWRPKVEIKVELKSKLRHITWF
jgi:hypothetical protein